MAYEDLIATSTGQVDIYQMISSALGVSLKVAIALFVIISIWALVWKGFALWKSARKNSPIWFIILLIINTVGILEILYIFVFSKIGKGNKNKAKTQEKHSPKKSKKKK